MVQTNRMLKFEFRNAPSSLLHMVICPKSLIRGKCIGWKGYLPVCQASRRLARRVFHHPQPYGLGIGYDSNFCSFHSLAAKSFSPPVLEERGVEQ